MRNKFDSISKIKDYKQPLLMFHGDKDNIVPFHSGHKLYQAANEPKQFVKLPGSGHDSIEKDINRELFWEKAIEFLNELPSDHERIIEKKIDRVNA